VEKVDPMGRLVHKVGLLVGFVGAEGLTGGRVHKVGRLVGLRVAIVSYGGSNRRLNGGPRCDSYRRSCP